MENYKLQKSETPNFWVLTDLKNEYVIVFEHKKYNETQKITPLNDENPDDFMLIARILRQAGEWLVKHHSDKAF
ncbi:MAG: hypothetical protein KDD03_02315 [Gelidibacter sp.]|nr:hypothetical protein [Gelidibacter sp.]